MAASRRNTLKLIALGGAGAVAAYALHEYAPWVDYDAEALLTRRALPLDPTLESQMQGIIRYATLAANGHNAQAWKFAIVPDGIEIYPDFARRLAAVDPADRELWISLGCALENLLQASRAVGYAPVVSYPDTQDRIRIALVADKQQPSSTYDAIPLRQSTRSEYDGKPLEPRHLNALQNVAVEEGIRIHFQLDQAGLSTLSDYIHQATLSQYADQPFVKELIHWLRFDKKEALASLDGLYSPCAGSPTVPRWLGQLFVNGSKPKDLADADVQKLRSSSGAVVITSASDRKADWVRTGQVYQRLALTMTSLNIKSAFLNQPLEVATVRSQLQSGLALGPAQPQLLVRFGYANDMPQSLRRPVEQVLMTS